MSRCSTRDAVKYIKTLDFREKAMDIRLETERLVLRKFEESDMEVLIAK